MSTKLSRLRLLAFERQFGLCYYCDSPMWQKTPSQFALKYRITVGQAKRFQCTAEHLIAVKDGGPTSRTNIAAACHNCNQKRHRRRIELSCNDFKKLVARRLSRRRWHPSWFFKGRMYYLEA